MQGDPVQQIGLPVFVRFVEELEVCVSVRVRPRVDPVLAADGAAHCRVQVVEKEGGDGGCGRVEVVEVACVLGAEVAPVHDEPVRRFYGSGGVGLRPIKSSEGIGLTGGLGVR